MNEPKPETNRKLLALCAAFALLFGVVEIILSFHIPNEEHSRLLSEKLNLITRHQPHDHVRPEDVPQTETFYRTHRFWVGLVHVAIGVGLILFLGVSKSKTRQA